MVPLSQSSIPHKRPPACVSHSNQLKETQAFQTHSVVFFSYSSNEPQFSNAFLPTPTWSSLPSLISPHLFEYSANMGRQLTSPESLNHQRQSSIIRTLLPEHSLHSVQIHTEPFLFSCQNSFGNFLSSFISFHQKHNQHMHGCILAFLLTSFPSIRPLLFQSPWIHPSTC